MLLGVLFAACARRQFASGSPAFGPELAAVLSIEVLLVWPVTLYCLLVHPDWAWMYLRFDASHVSTGMVVMVLCAEAAALLTGYVGGWAMVRQQRMRLVNYALGALGLATLLFLALAHGRLLRYGSYEDYHAGRALPIGDVKLGWVLVVAILGVASAVALVGWTLYARGRGLAGEDDQRAPILPEPTAPPPPAEASHTG